MMVNERAGCCFDGHRCLVLGKLGLHARHFPLERLAEMYEADAERFAADLATFLDKLQKFGLL